MITTLPVLLALRALGLGDLLVAVPALRGLRAAFPDHYTLLAMPPWLHPLCELIGGWEPVSLAGLTRQPPGPHWVDAGLDVAVNLHGNGAQSAALLDSMAPKRRIGHRRPGWPGPEWVPELPERWRWCRLLAAHGIAADESDFRLPAPGVPAAPERAIVVHPGAAYGAKRWPVERFAKVAAAYPPSSAASASTSATLTSSNAGSGSSANGSPRGLRPCGARWGPPGGGAHRHGSTGPYRVTDGVP